MDTELKKNIDQFLSAYNESEMNAIWTSHQKKFMDFWLNRIMSDKSPQLKEEEIDEIVRMLDLNARGNTKNSVVVARVRINQLTWHKLFNDLKGSADHKKIIDQLFNTDDEKLSVRFLNELHALNEGWKNSLTGPSANGINTLLAAANPFNALHIVSLNDRRNLMEYLGYPSLTNFDEMSWGAKIVESARFILKSFRQAGIDNNARTISSFVYSPFLIDEWKTAEETESEEECNYWIFQGNPNRFDFAKEHPKGGVKEWSVSAHRQAIKPGDKVIIYQTGLKAGVYALAEITTEPYSRKVNPEDATWKGEDQFNYAVGIRVTHDISQHPIFRETIDSTPELSGMSGGSQGTNFRATSSEFRTLLKLINEKPMKRYWLYAPGPGAIKWDEFYREGIIALDWPELGDLRNYPDKESVRTALQEGAEDESSRKNSVMANFEFCNVMEIGDIVIAKRGKREYIGYGVVTSEYRFDEKKQNYQSYRRIDWKKKGIWTAKGDIVVKTLTDITKYPDYVVNLINLIGIGKEATGSQPQTMLADFVNTILFGPPGTGKTYNTINHALEIIHGKRYVEDLDRPLLKKRFEALVAEGQICFTTFHQSMSYEDFIEGIKPENHSADGSLTYDVKDGLFKEFSEKARSNWSASKAGISSQLTFEEAWSKFLEDWEEDPEMKIPTIQKHYTIIGIKPKSIAFKKASGSTSHTLSINTLRDYYYGTREMSEGGLKVYYPGLVEKLKSYQGTNTSSPLKNYVLIIDEINRGNVSQIFGELITLIESDKRLGMTEALKVTLPYSGEEFGVPPNLYIIGTMNTADRSVEALDAALRRRFSFTEMPPKYDLSELNRVVNGVLLSSLLKTINVRIEKLLDRDHAIGHSYFLGDSINLKDIFKNKIIPLLQEYFFGDYGKIGLVLGNGFVELENSVNPSTVFADFDYDEKMDLAERKVYRLKSFDKEEDFNNALQTLMGKS